MEQKQENYSAEIENGVVKSITVSNTQEDNRNYNQAFVRLFGPDGKEVIYNGYKAQKADFIELALRGKEIIFPAITNGTTIVEKAIVFDQNGVALAEMSFPERWIISVGETPIVNFGVTITEDDKDEEVISPKEKLSPEEVQKAIFDTPLQFHREKQSSEAVDLLRMISENCVHIGGSDYRINEKYLDPIKLFLSRLTD